MKHEVQRQLPAKPSIEVSKRLLQADTYAYTDEEVSLLIDFLYRLAAIDLSIYEETLRTETPIININQFKDDHSTKSIPISQSQYGRTG